jgi:hypothetical protein
MVVPIMVRGHRHRAKDQTAFVVDRSTGGLCLAWDRQLLPGQFLSVRAANAPDSIPWVQVEVRNSRRWGGDGWLIGCQFVEQPPWNVLLLFG